MSNPSEARGNSITAREILDKGATQIERELTDQPLVQAPLMSTMGTVYRRLGLPEQACPFLEQTLTKRRDLLGEDHPNTPLTMNNLAVLDREQGRYDEARQLIEGAIAITERTRGTEDARYPVYIHTLGELLLATGKARRGGTPIASCPGNLRIARRPRASRPRSLPVDWPFGTSGPPPGGARSSSPSPGTGMGRPIDS